MPIKNVKQLRAKHSFGYGWRHLGWIFNWTKNGIKYTEQGGGRDERCPKAPEDWVNSAFKEDFLRFKNT